MVIKDHEDLTSALNGEKCRVMIRREPYEWEMIFCNELIQRVIRLNGYTHVYVGDSQDKTEIIEIKNDELFFMFIGENVVTLDSVNFLKLEGEIEAKNRGLRPLH